jgi:hypothetical protein
MTEADDNSGGAFPTDGELDAAGWVRKSRRDRRILSRPRVGQYCWVDFPHDAYVPEFVGEHPGVVIRAARSLNDTDVTPIFHPAMTRVRG